MNWIVKINGKRRLKTREPEEASRKALLWWGRSMRTDLVQIFSLGPCREEVLVEEWLPENKAALQGEEG